MKTDGHYVALADLVELRPDPDSVIAEEISKINGNMTDIGTDFTEDTKFVPAEEIYGNRKDTNSVYKYVFPIVLGSMFVDYYYIVIFSDSETEEGELTDEQSLLFSSD